MPKYLLIFEKNEPVRWLGHLDILRTFERAIRRAGLPIAFSNGFNPREKISFVSALSVGITSGGEPALIELTEPVPAAEVTTRLNDALPPGIRIASSLETPDDRARDLMQSFDRAVYEVVCACPDEVTEEAAETAIETLMAQPTICITREKEGRAKSLDIRPMALSLALRPGSIANGRLILEMTLALGESGTGRPGEVVTALAEHLPGLTLRRAHRARLLSNQEREGDST